MGRPARPSEEAVGEGGVVLVSVSRWRPKSRVRFVEPSMDQGAPPTSRRCANAFVLVRMSSLSLLRYSFPS